MLGIDHDRKAQRSALSAGNGNKGAPDIIHRDRNNDVAGERESDSSYFAR